MHGEPSLMGQDRFDAESPMAGADLMSDVGLSAQDGTPPDISVDRELSGLFFVPGPAPEAYDCRSGTMQYPRRAGSPWGCVGDSQCSSPLVVGHRGAGGQFSMVAPENSLAGLRAAVEMGLDGVELDVRHTSDDELVVIHDSTVDRTTFGSGSVAEMTLSTLQALPLKPIGHPDLRGDFSCERVPSLMEVFDFTRGRLFVDLDVKTERVELVVAAIVAADLLDQVYFSTKNVDQAVRARHLEPRLRIQIRPQTVEDYQDALSRFDRPPEVVEIPPTLLETLAPLIEANGLRVFVNVFGLDTRALSTREPSYREVFELGAHIVQSEFPHLVLSDLGR